MLSTDQYQKSAQYIKQYARPLEKALYAYQFEGGSKETVLKELAAYQNEDGGFGKALECDVRVNDSSILATTVAFQKFREIAAPADHPLVKSGAEYLIKTYDSVHKIWQFIPPNIGDAPHAPWWEYHGKPEGYLANPRAEIVGILYDYPNLFPESLCQDLTQAVFAHLKTYVNDEMEMHELLCYIRLLESKGLPPEAYGDLQAKLTPFVEKAVSRNPADWGGYGLTPLAVVTSKQSPFFSLFEAVIPQNLAYLVEQQHADGYWSPTWSWEFVSVEAWAQAEQELRGIFTLNNLLLFREFAG